MSSVKGSLQLIGDLGARVRSCCRSGSGVTPKLARIAGSVPVDGHVHAWATYRARKLLVACEARVWQSNGQGATCGDESDCASSFATFDLGTLGRSLPALAGDNITLVQLNVWLQGYRLDFRHAFHPGVRQRDSRLMLDNAPYQTLKASNNQR